MLARLVSIFSSLRLTVLLLALGLVLVFLGTMAQEPLGLYAAQNRFFRSFFVDANSMRAALHKTADMFMQGIGHPLGPLNSAELLAAPQIPAFPGGYLIGGLLLVNLFAAHFRYYQPGKKKYGIVMIHAGVVLLLVGQLLTDLLSTESQMHLRQGEIKNYSESTSVFELAVIATTDAAMDKVVAIPVKRLQRGGDITHTELPFSIRVKTFYPNSLIAEKPTKGFDAVGITTGFGADLWWRRLPHETEMDKRDMPSGVIELLTPQGSMGAYLVSAFFRPQVFTHGGRQYQLVLRPERFYKMHSLQLIEFRFDRYLGTEIPKNFSSRVRLQRADTGEDREVLIYMNNPLRYGGETYYQYNWDKEDEKGTLLQVVRNPSWLTPYFSCVLVGAGLLVQFLTHLIGFAKKQKTP